MLRFSSVLHILDINPLLEGLLAKVFSSSIRLSPYSVVSFVVQKFFNLQFHLLILVITSCALGVLFRRSLPVLMA